MSARCRSYPTKERFDTENAARRVARLRMAAKQFGVVIRPYPCKVCEGYHLTHRPFGKRGSKRDRARAATEAADPDL